MTPADKRKTIAAIRQVARWMSDPRHRVKKGSHVFENAAGGLATLPSIASRTCILGACEKIAPDDLCALHAIERVAETMKGVGWYFAEWTTAELRKLFAESIRAVEKA